MGTPWSPQRRAAQAVAQAARMKRLNVRMRDDETLARKRIAGIRRARGCDASRAVEAAVMVDKHVRHPHLRRIGMFNLIRFHRMSEKITRRRVGRPRRKPKE